ncbi:Mucin-2 [Lobaria immixta]|nr:Mucin-2 [Lobaria immixta]
MPSPCSNPSNPDPDCDYQITHESRDFFGPDPGPVGNTAVGLGDTISVEATPPTSPGENTALVLPTTPDPGSISSASLQPPPIPVTGFNVPASSPFLQTDSTVSANTNPPTDSISIATAPVPNTPTVPDAIAPAPVAVPPSTPDIPLPNSATPNIRENALNNVLGTNSAFNQNTNPIVSLAPDGRIAVTPEPVAGPIFAINPSNGLPTLGYQTQSDRITVSPLTSAVNAISNPGNSLNNGAMINFIHRFGP